MPEQPDDLLVPADADRTVDLNRGAAPASTGSNALVEVEVLDVLAEPAVNAGVPV